MGSQVIDGVHFEGTFTAGFDLGVDYSLDDRSFRLLFSCLPLGLCVVTRDHRIVEANRAMSAMLGYAEGELVGKSIYELTDPADLVRTDDFVRQVQPPDCSSRAMLKRYRRKDGTAVFGKETVVSIRDASGTISRRLAIVEDLTEQAHLEDVLRTARETTHQVGNSLTQAQGYTEIALFQDNLLAETRELLTLAMNGFAAVTANLQSLQRIWKMAAGPGTGKQNPENRIQKTH
jgi:PAS domain S-box-containing protein